MRYLFFLVVLAGCSREFLPQAPRNTRTVHLCHLDDGRYLEYDVAKPVEENGPNGMVLLGSGVVYAVGGHLSFDKTKFKFYKNTHQ